MVHLAVAAEVTADESAELFLDLVFQTHGLPDSISASGSTLGGEPTSKSVQESTEPPLPQSTTPTAQDTTVEVHALHGMAYEESLTVDAAAPAASIVANANFAPKPTLTPIDSAAVSDVLRRTSQALSSCDDPCAGGGASAAGAYSEKPYCRR
ncbi:unnamed protein product [Phytophthora fragariaefolia]|uniref:Unnamed protein product n=1 Tax=Phytophthora fragariaefolia TaxID=1490495 RepID=A0A9W7CUA8_9STRA|nr:unnamed protein product [Phytophthora fragariaefolia]